MENTFMRAEALMETAEEYLDNKLELTKIETVEFAAEWMSKAIVMLLISLHMLLFVIFISIAAAITLGVLLNNPMLGFSIMAFVYLLVMLIIWKSRKKWIRLPLLKVMADRFIKIENEFHEEK